MARGFGIRYAWTEMGLAKDDIVSRSSIKIIQGPTSLAILAYCALIGESLPEFKLSVDVMSQWCI